MFSRRTLLYRFDNTNLAIPRDSSMTYTTVQLLIVQPKIFF